MLASPTMVVVANLTVPVVAQLRQHLVVALDLEGLCGCGGAGMGQVPPVVRAVLLGVGPGLRLPHRKRAHSVPREL